jgi:mono/diheme cytochrome c family protein
MKTGSYTLALVALGAAVVACAGCTHAPGYPKPGDEVLRPDKELDFQALYKQNCSGCHGDNGRNGAAIALNNPAYLVIAGADHIRTATANGVSGTLMPAFARSAGGMLTEEQVNVLVQGMIHDWARPSEFNGVNLPPYSSELPGNASDGKTAYAEACARCHGIDGTGIQDASQKGGSHYSIVDRSYLALVNDQSLRSIVVAGHPDKDAHDWRSYIASPSARPLTAQEINDIVAWIAQHRNPNSEQSMSMPRGGRTPVAGKEAK